MIEAEICVSNITYELVAAIYYSNNHFTARFCRVTNGIISQKWYLYDGMKNEGSTVEKQLDHQSFAMGPNSFYVQNLYYKLK